MKTNNVLEILNKTCRVLGGINTKLGLCGNSVPRLIGLIKTLTILSYRHTLQYLTIFLKNAVKHECLNKILKFLVFINSHHRIKYVFWILSNLMINFVLPFVAYRHSFWKENLVSGILMILTLNKFHLTLTLSRFQTKVYFF